MRWPWQQRETRQSGYTDAVIAAIVQASTGTTTSTTSTAAVESAAGLLGRAFASAEVSSPNNEITRAITPEILNLIGRTLLRDGESVWAIDVVDGRLSLLPAGSWTVNGYSTDPMEWWYRLDMFSPSGSTTRYLPGASILHFKYSVDASRPWVGLSPLQWASTSARLNAEAERSLADEAGGPIAQMLSIPVDGGDGGDDDTLAMLKKDIAAARGGALLVETTSSGWGDGQSAAPHRDWHARRLGPDPAGGLNTARRESMAGILAACGVPPDLMDPDSSGTAQREAYRRWFASTAQPIARIVEHELSVKLETPVSLDMTSLYAHDLVGRAAAFQRLTAGGVSINEALTTSGLLAADAEDVAA